MSVSFSKRLYLFAGEEELSEDEDDIVDNALFTTIDFGITGRESLYEDSYAGSSDCFCVLVLIICGFGGLSQS